MGSCKFQYKGSTPESAQSSVDGEETDESVRDSLGINPIFNFPQSFVGNLNSISPDELGRSIPYVEVSLVNKDGSIIQNLNLNFFHKTVDVDLLSSGQRFADRPTMSLKDVQIKTSLASGYLFYTHVTLNIRIHNPAILDESILLALLFPAAPVLLRYGWNSPNEFLNNSKEELLWSVSTYNLSMDETGQVDLSIEGYAYSEQFDNAIIGDGNYEHDTEQFDGQDLIFKNAEQLEELIEHINDMKEAARGTNNYGPLKKLAVRLHNREEAMRGEISKRFKEKKAELRELKGPAVYTGKGAERVEAVPLHDILYVLLHETLCDVTETMAGIDHVRFVYGSFNEKAGVLAGKSIADFPIPWRKFNNKLKAEVQKGQYVLTVKQLLNLLLREFLENKQIWNRLLSGAEKEEFLMPDVLITVTGRRAVVDGEETGYLEVAAIDVREGLPPTTSLMPTEKGSKSVLLDEAASNALPIIRTGHANSFIKSLNLGHIMDQYMKAVLIERMHRDRLESRRDTLVPGLSLASKPTTPLTLPLKGTMEVIGHPGWKPFRAFFLSSGIYIVDAIYKITNVTHTLGSQGFTTSVEFMYH